MDASGAGSALCAPFLRALPVTGLSISVMSEGGAQSTVGTTDPVAARLEELQFQLGEGPTGDVLRSGRAILVPDLAHAVSRAAWPVFGASALEAGARGVFCFPLAIGAMRVGVVSLYCLDVLPVWSSARVRTATRLADAAVRPAIALATRSAAAAPSSGAPQTELRREVHQASGMVMVQLRCGVDEALARLRARAFAEGRSVDAVAHDVLARTLRFTPDEQ